MNKLTLLSQLCRHHRDNHTSGNSQFLVEYIVKLLNLSSSELHQLADWQSQMPPAGGDGA